MISYCSLGGVTVCVLACRSDDIFISLVHLSTLISENGTAHLI